MKNEDKMIDALLHEHARQGNGDDADFLASLEQRLDEEERGDEVSSAGKTTNRRAGSRVGLGLGIAAGLTVAAVGFYGWHQSRQQEKSAIAAYDAEVPVRQVGGAHEGTGDLLSPPTAAKSGAKDGVASGAKHSPVPEVRQGGVVPAPSGGQAVSKVTPARSVSAPIVDDARGDSGKVDASKDVVSLGGYRKESVKPSVMRTKARVPMVGRACLPGPDYPVAHGSRYGSLTDNSFKSPWKEPLSTFSIDVDTASYSNVRRMIRNGQRVPAGAVRIEEMINYFSYSYPQPEGRHPFSVHVETASCPWNSGHRLVKVGLQGKEVARRERPAANLVFLLDVSGSMNSRDKLPLLVDSMKILLRELNADDSVSIVVYAGAQGLALPPTHVNEEGRKTILAKLDNLRSGGSTNGGAGIKLAYKTAKKHFVKGGVNRVILGTDGDFNVGITGTGALTRLVEREAKSGVFLSVLGFGRGNLNDAMLETITNKGNGNYHYIDCLREGRKVFLDDLMGTMVTIAKDVKIQVEFNPAKVKSYRLIGYSNRMLKAEDFRNKRIDAGEIGAGHSVTALYEIIPGNAAEAAPAVDDLEFQRFKKPASRPTGREVVASPHSLVVKLAYKLPDATKETESSYFRKRVTDSGQSWQEASEDFKFASGVGLFGMLLRGSDYAGQGTYQLVSQLAEQGRGSDPKGHRTEFSDLVRRVR